MTTFTAEQKSQLAKLMATENLTVQHQKIRTAKFDPVNRVLYLPIWQDMSGDLYDLLCGHEVGHALYTPATGWHDAVVDKSKGKNFKSFLNVVEDARIEKKVKRRYPGLNKSFRNAYQELMDRDFFGIKNRDINGMAFVERLNIFTKSQYTATYIKFSQDEQNLINKVLALETWDDVMRVTDEIYAYSKDEQFEMMEMQDFQSFGRSDDGDDYEDDYEYDYDSEETDSNQEPERSSEKPKDTKQSDEAQDEQPEETDEADDSENKNESGNQDVPESEEQPKEVPDENGTKLNRFKDSTESYGDQFAPKCETDDTYRTNEDLLLDEKCKEYVYINVPTIQTKNVYTPAKRVQELLSEYYDGRIDDKDPFYALKESYVKELVTEFKRKNERYVSLLAKEFEMRKAAKAFAKNKVSDSGDIDIGRLAGYKFDDNIFRKVMHIPKGKSHGLVLLLDYSGSMSDNMAGSIEQILVLTMFCRKVNIPFVVYSFTDNMDVRYIDMKLDRNTIKENDLSSFANNVGEICLSNVHLREYLNSKMTNAEYNKCLRNMVLLKEGYSQGRYTKIGRPESESLANTPLIQSIFAIAPVMQEFKKINNLDMTSLIVVHDGDSDYTHSVNVQGEFYDRRSGQNIIGVATKWFDQRYQNVVLVDRKNKFETKLEEKGASASDPLLRATLTWFKAVTKSKVFGFFIVAGRNGYARAAIYNRYVDENGKSIQDLKEETNHWVAQDKSKELVKKLREDKFLVSNTKGYNEFYMISGGNDLQTDDEDFEFEGKVTAHRLKSAFMKFNKQKQVNRVLVSRFIQGIAA